VTLSDRDLAFLAFEGEWRRHAGAKEEAIRAEFEITPARYYQLLGRLIETPEALAHDPMLVRRLRRRRDDAAEMHRSRVTRSATR
jgi:hypothetical protein